MIKALCALVLILVLFSCQKQKEVLDATPALKNTSALPLSCGTDAVTAKFSNLINRKNKEAQSRMKSGIRMKTTVPQSSKTFVVFLDVNGAVVKNTLWNRDGDIVAAPSGLTRQQIEEVTKSVQDDFSPWLIEVTTDEARYNAAAPDYRIRCILTQRSDWFCGIGNLCAGGVAFVGSGFWGDNTPCFVFTNALQVDEKYSAEAVSHEVGHTLGLQHQSVWDNSCRLIAEYNSGYGSGPTSFAPIMGVGYYSRITNWFIGASIFDCSIIQNDFALISANIPLARDAEGLQVKNEFEGVLNYGGDTDINNVFLRGGGTMIRATSENADLKITLLNKKGEIVAFNTISQDTDAEIYVKRGGKFQLMVEAVSNKSVSRQFMTGKYHIQIKR